MSRLDCCCTPSSRGFSFSVGVKAPAIMLTMCGFSSVTAVAGGVLMGIKIVDPVSQYYPVVLGSVIGFSSVAVCSLAAFVLTCLRSCGCSKCNR
ncbi:MAG: hypothetical protein JXA94_04040 [Parachlamydiales bacterium]|nr:hypothetical protein [Parachlamydiales bacterium]